MLGSLEAKVLGVLERKDSANVREVVDELNDGDENLAYTTVGTILDRLYEKGLVERAEEPYKGGSRYVYEYVDFRDEYIDEVLRDVVALFGDEGLEELRRKAVETEGEKNEDADIDLKKESTGTNGKKTTNAGASTSTNMTGEDTGTRL